MATVLLLCRRNILRRLRTMLIQIVEWTNHPVVGVGQGAGWIVIASNN